MSKNVMQYQDVFNGKRFFHLDEKMECTKIGNCYAVDDEGKEHIFGLYDPVVVIPYKNLPFIEKHLVAVNGLYTIV